MTEKKWTLASITLADSGRESAILVEYHPPNAFSRYANRASRIILRRDRSGRVDAANSVGVTVTAVAAASLADLPQAAELGVIELVVPGGRIIYNVRYIK